MLREVVRAKREWMGLSISPNELLALSSVGGTPIEILLVFRPCVQVAVAYLRILRGPPSSTCLPRALQGGHSR